MDRSDPHKARRRRNCFCRPIKMGWGRIKGYWFHKEGDTTLPPQLQFENVLWIDRGHRVFDHHGIKGKTSVLIVSEELGINNEKWIQPIIRHVHRSDLQGQS
jgi:hypothetical protein